MAIIGYPCALRFTIRVNMQNDPSDLAPVGGFGVSVKQAQVSHQMLLVISSQRRGGRRDVSNNGIKRRVRHVIPTQIFTISTVSLHLLEGINGCTRIIVEDIRGEILFKALPSRAWKYERSWHSICGSSGGPTACRKRSWRTVRRSIVPTL